MRHVALLIETSGSYGRGLLRGVAQFNREHGAWSTYFHPHGLGDPPPPWLTHWKGDGILARIDTPEVAELIARSGVPAVNLRAMMHDLPFPYVGLDNEKAARLAAEHLLERGLKRFAFCGRAPGQHPSFDERCSHFRKRVEEAGYPCEIYPADDGGHGGRKARGGHGASRARANGRGDEPWEQAQARLAAWVAALEKPVGIMTCNDERGLQVLDACRRGQIAVPDEVSVIGMDNDEHLCDLSIPPLTSVDVNAERIGYEAASLLDQMMCGHKPADRPPKLAPRGIVTRQSTDAMFSEDPEVNRAIRYIRDHERQWVRVGDVLTHTGMSRASLQQRMKRVLGRTIHQEIERVRLARVKRLLLVSEKTIKQVVSETGFSSVQYLTRVFRANVGETPAQYRKRRAR